MPIYKLYKRSHFLTVLKQESCRRLLQCLQAKTVQYEKDDYILLAGSLPKYVGVILCGRIQVVKDDITGNRTLITSLGPGGIFGETLCCAGVQESPVSVVAESACTVLLLAFSKILHICSNACVFHGRLIQNMLLLLAKRIYIYKAACVS